MARPRMRIGEWGSITLTPLVQNADGKFIAAPANTRKPHQWRARAKVRDTDGKIREVERRHKNKTTAEALLKEALVGRSTPPDPSSTINSTTLMSVAAASWLATVEDARRVSSGTLRVYRSSLRHVVGRPDKPAALAHLTVAEIKVSTVERFLSQIAHDKGPGAARTARSVLRGVLDHAVKHDAIPTNPVRSASAIPRTTPKLRSDLDPRRAFTMAERDMIVRFGDEDSRAKRRDLGDLVAFLAGTGARIGEACAVRWSHLDLANSTATLGPQVIRIKGQGLSIQEQGKTELSNRVVKLPAWLVRRLKARRKTLPANEWHAVFPSPLGKLRDPSNTSHDVRDLLTDAGFPWASSHTFRKTVATLLDEAGISGREVANQLGHARVSMTTDVYMSRKTITERAAEVL